MSRPPGKHAGNSTHNQGIGENAVFSEIGSTSGSALHTAWTLPDPKPQPFTTPKGTNYTHG